MHFFSQANWCFFLIILLSISQSNLIAQPLQLLDSQKTYNNIGKSTWVLKDKTQNLTITQVSSAAFANQWEKAMQDNLSFGLDNKTAYWVRIAIEKPSNLPNDWLIEMANPFIDSLTIYKQLANGDFSSQLTGYWLPFKTRGIKHTGFVIPLDFSQQNKQIIYLRTRGHDPLLVPLQVIRSNAFYEEVRLQDVGYGIYFGILLVMILYNCFLFYAIGDKNYLYYVITIFSTFVIFASVSGYLFMYLWQSTAFINRYIAHSFMSLIVIVTAIFTQSFLQTQKYNKFLHYAISLMVLLGIAAVICQLLGIYRALPNMILSVFTPLLVITSLVCWLKGNQSARYYFFAWICYLVGGMAIIFRNSGKLPYNSFTSHAVEVGSALEVVLLSLALADRYRRLKIEKETAQRQALAIQKEANENLEQKVTERTRELKETNEELSQTNEELHTTMEILEEKREELRSKNEDITASINYAKRIQRAVLPTENSFSKHFGNSFIIFKPRDIVSGDFYWVTTKDNFKIVAAADCTGHGVPGAFMSMIGNDLLNQIITEKSILQPNLILAELNKNLTVLLKQESQEVDDGMDIIVCAVNETEKYFEYAGAMNPLYYVENQKFIEIKADKQAIGGHSIDDKKFTLHTTSYQSPTILYLFSDGYQDQFGGEKNRKFMVKKLKELLATVCEKPLNEQKTTLDTTFENWKGGNRQIDDVMVIGIAL
jgi:serine phosphatase RsbU (regulator of sigma subunit)